MTATTRRFACGPLDVDVISAHPAIDAKMVETLGMYDQPWPEPRRPVHIVGEPTDDAPPRVDGTYLCCSRMAVDRVGDDVVAATRCGAHIRSTSSAGHDCWRIVVPNRLVVTGRFEELDELEDLIGLAVTTGWRRAGWVPVHAAGVVDGERVAVVCSTSGGGKSTLSAVMVRRGWATLGDDKLLLRVDHTGTPEVRSLLSTYNLHPRTAEWLPELGPIDHLPRYSGWTEKRRVPAAAIAPEAMCTAAVPTHLVELRRVDRPGARVTGLGANDTLSVLLRQTVLPSDAATTKPIVAALGITARRLRGVRLEVGPDAYGVDDVAAVLDEALV